MCVLITQYSSLNNSISAGKLCRVNNALSAMAECVLVTFTQYDVSAYALGGILFGSLYGRRLMRVTCI